MATRSHETPRGVGISLTPRSSIRSDQLSLSVRRDSSKRNPFEELDAPKFDHFLDSVKLKIKLALDGPQLASSPVAPHADVFGAVESVQTATGQVVSREAEQLEDSLPLPSQNRQFSSPTRAPPHLPTLPPLFDPTSDEEDHLPQDEPTEDEESFQVAEEISLVSDDPVDSFAEKYDEYEEDDTEEMFPPLLSSPPPATSSTGFPGFVSASHFLANSSPGPEFESVGTDSEPQAEEYSESDDDDDLTMEQLFPTRRARAPASNLGSAIISINIEAHDDIDMDDAEEESEFFDQQFVDVDMPDPRSPLPGFSFLDEQIIDVEEEEVGSTSWEEARAAAREGAESRMGPRTQLADYLPSEDVSEVDQEVPNVLPVLDDEETHSESSDENLGSRIPHHLKGKERATTSPPPQLRTARSSSSLSTISNFSEISFDTLRTYSAQRLGELCEMTYEQIEEMTVSDEEDSEELEAIKRYFDTLQEAYTLRMAAGGAPEEEDETDDLESAADPAEAGEEEEGRELPFEESDSGGAVGQWSQNVVPYRRDRTVSPNYHSPRQPSTPPRVATSTINSYEAVQAQINDLDFAAILQSLADQRRVPVTVPNPGMEGFVAAVVDEEMAVVDTLMDFQQADIPILDPLPPTQPLASISPSVITRRHFSSRDENGPTSKAPADSRSRRSSTPPLPPAAREDPSFTRPLPYNQGVDYSKLPSEAYEESEEERENTPNENIPPPVESSVRTTLLEYEENEDVATEEPKAIEEISLLDTSDEDEEEESVDEQEDELESPPASPGVHRSVEPAALASPAALVDYDSSDESIPDRLLPESDIAVPSNEGSPRFILSPDGNLEISRHPLMDDEDIVVREDTGSDMLREEIVVSDIPVLATDPLEVNHFVETQLQEETLQSIVDPLDIDISRSEPSPSDTTLSAPTDLAAEQPDASTVTLDQDIFVSPIPDSSSQPLTDISNMTTDLPSIEALEASIAALDRSLLVPQNLDPSLFPHDTSAELVDSETTAVDDNISPPLPPHPLDVYVNEEPIDLSNIPAESLNALIYSDLPESHASDAFDGHEFGGGEREMPLEAEESVEVFEREDSSRDGIKLFEGAGVVKESLDAKDEQVALVEAEYEIEISEIKDHDLGQRPPLTLSDHPLFATADDSFTAAPAVVEHHLEIDIPMPPLSTLEEVALAADTSVVDILTPIVERVEEERELIVAEDLEVEKEEGSMVEESAVEDDTIVVEAALAPRSQASRRSRSKKAQDPSSEDELTLVPSQRPTASLHGPLAEEVVSALAFTPTSITRRRSPRKSQTPVPFGSPPRASAATLLPVPDRATKSPSPDRRLSSPSRIVKSPPPTSTRVTRSTTPGALLLSPEATRRSSLRSVAQAGSQESPKKRTRSSVTPEPSSVNALEVKEREEEVRESAKKQKSRRVTRSPSIPLSTAADAPRGSEEAERVSREPQEPIVEVMPPRIHAHAHARADPAADVPAPAPSASATDSAPSTPSAKIRNAVTHLPVTRSHCVFAKIQIVSRLTASTRPYVFIVPSCALSSALAQETIKEFDVVNQGVPTTAEDSAAVPLGVAGDQGETEELIEKLVVEEDVRTALRRIVGVELLLEGTCRMVQRVVLRSSQRDTPGKRKREDEAKEEVKKKKV